MFSGRWKWPWNGQGLSEEAYRQQRARLLEHVPVPVMWLFGKTGSGKTSIIRYLTGAEQATIGDGFRPQTRFSRRFIFPSESEPLITFLDTRGLGEATYDPQEDLASFSSDTHLVVVTVRVSDQALGDVIVPLRKIRAAQPHRPIVLAVTCLHEAYPRQQHPDVDPLQHLKATELVNEAAWPDTLLPRLRTLLADKSRQFWGLVDAIVPIDLTKPEEGFETSDYGGDRLKQTLLEMLPTAYRQALLSLSEVLEPLKNLNERRAMPYVVSYSMSAAAAAAVPVPWVDIPVVTAIQSHMVQRLAAIYGQKMNAATFLRLAGPLAGRILLRVAIREALKVIPYVGSVANAGASFAYTMGLGRACCWYFGQRKLGNAPSAKELEQVWQKQISHAARVWKHSQSDKEAS